MPVAITPRAIEQLRRLVAKSGDANAMVRIGVKAGGCSGMEYVLRLEKDARADDSVYELDGVRIIIDPQSPRFLEGAIVDWTGNLLGNAFSFTNPNASRSCGCGTSFTL